MDVIFLNHHVIDDRKLSMELFLFRFMDDINKHQDRNHCATPNKIKEYRELSGEMTWIGYGVLPQATYFGSYMQ